MLNLDFREKERIAFVTGRNHRLFAKLDDAEEQADANSNAIESLESALKRLLIDGSTDAAIDNAIAEFKKSNDPRSALCISELTELKRNLEAMIYETRSEIHAAMRHIKHTQE